MVLATLWTTGAQAGDITPLQPGIETVGDAEWAAHDRENVKHEGYLERWMTFVERDDGGWMQISMVLTNFGPGDENAVIDVLRFAPPYTDPAAPIAYGRYPRKYPKGTWSLERSGRFRLRAGACDLQRTATGWTLKGTTWSTELELTATLVEPGWKPGNGRIGLPEGHVLSYAMLAGKVRIEGRERLLEGTWRPFKGTGFGEHGLSTMLPYQLADRWVRLDGRAGPYRVHFVEVTLTPKLGSERHGWLLVMKDGKVVASSLEATAKVLESKRDPVEPHHAVPMRYSVTAKTRDGPVALEVALGRLAYREDLLQVLPAAVRSFISMFLQPMNYFFRARLSLTLPGGATASGKNAWAVFSPLRAGRQMR